MIRKGTWVILGVFAALLGLAFYLQSNPLPAADAANATPSATAAPQLLEGWQPADIVYIEQKGQEGSVTLTKNSDGSWTLGPQNARPAAIDKVESLTSQLISTRPLSALNTSSALDALGLAVPVNILTLRNTQGQQVDLKIGAKTPTGSGYYVQNGNSAPVIVSSYTIDTVIGLLKPEELAAPTPTPPVDAPTPADGGAAPDATPTATTTQ